MVTNNLFSNGESLLNKPMNATKTTTLRAIDLFAGIGGIRKGFKSVFKNEIEFVFSSEIDKNAQKTYYLNYKEIPHGDITTIDEKDIPCHDIILAGFPCQAFSVAGHRKGFEDTRGTLFFDVIRIAKHHKPKVIFLENVKGFVNHDNGNTFKVVKKSLIDLGYTLYHQVLNTKDFGIPQNRERIYIIALLNTSSNFIFPTPIKKSLKIEDLLQKSVDKQFYYNDKPLYSKIKDDITKSDTLYQWRRQYVRENKNNLCPTLTANMGTGGHNVPIVKDKNGIRKLTPRECLNFQGFDDKFIFPKDLALSHQYKQAGNSVTVKVIEELAKKIKDVL